MWSKQIFLTLLLVSSFSFAEETVTKKAEEHKKQEHKKQYQKKHVQKKKAPIKYKTKYYPKPNAKPIVLGKEKYGSAYKSLQGLKGVYINLDPYLKGYKARGMKAEFDVKKAVISILKKHHLKLLTKKEAQKYLGQPTLNLSPSFPAFLGPYKKGEKHKKPKPNCCSAGLSGAYTEGVSTLRHSDINMVLTTWKASENTSNCTKLKKWFPQAVIKVVKKFVADKDKANKVYVPAKKKVVKKKVVKKKVVHKKVATGYTGYTGYSKKKIIGYELVKEPLYRKVVTYKNVPNKKVVTHYKAPVHKVVEHKTVYHKPVVHKVVQHKTVYHKPAVVHKPKPVIKKPIVHKPVYKKPVSKKPIVKTPAKDLGCNMVMMMYIELFKTNSTRIIKSKYFVLDKLAETIKKCPTYEYVIESHADQRASFEYNDKLSRNRGKSIAQYLYTKGVKPERFKIESYGEMRPINLGTTEEDYATNRRVVVIPHKIKGK